MVSATLDTLDIPELDDRLGTHATFEALDMFSTRSDDYVPIEYRVKWATLPWECNEAYALRRAVIATGGFGVAALPAVEDGAAG